MPTTNCTLANGYDLGCFGTGGVKKVWFATFSKLSAYTYTALTGTVATVTDSADYFAFEQDIESASFNENIPVSRENGTVFYESTVSIKMFNNDATLRNTVKALAKAPLTVIIEDNSGLFWLMGAETAVRLSEGSRGFGQLYGDMNGATLTFSYKSADPIPNILAANEAALITAGFELQA